MTLFNTERLMFICLVSYPYTDYKLEFNFSDPAKSTRFNFERVLLVYKINDAITCERLDRSLNLVDPVLRFDSPYYNK